MRIHPSSFCLVLGLLSALSCRLYLTSEELTPESSFRQEDRADAAPTLVEFYFDPVSLQLLEEESYNLRMLRLNEAGRQDHAESFAVGAGYKMLLLEPGIWQILELCQRPCRGYVARTRGLPTFEVLPSRVNYAGTFVVELSPDAEPTFEIQSFLELAREGVKKNWPQLSYPVEEAKK